MADWEYRFVDLFRGDQPRGSDGFEAFAEEIRLAGEDGWEAVGELALSFRPETEDVRYRSTVKTLLLKRPRETGHNRKTEVRTPRLTPRSAHL